MTRILPVLIATSFPGAAFAHVGHVGEVAGHSHWVAVGAVLAAAAIAAMAVKMKKGDKAEGKVSEEGVADEPEAEEKSA